MERLRFCSSVSRAQGSASSLLPLCLTHMGISDSDSDSDSRISCNRFRHRIVPLKNSNFFHFFITRFLGFWTVDCWIGILASYTNGYIIACKSNASWRVRNLHSPQAAVTVRMRMKWIIVSVFKTLVVDMYWLPFNHRKSWTFEGSRSSEKSEIGDINF